MRWFLCALLAASSHEAMAQVVLNEVFYDPPGADGGHEFVELYNAGSSAADLTGLQLWFLNGADPERPRVVWQSGPFSLAPGSFYVVGESSVEGDATTSLSLQNGPDAVWLVDGAGQVLDRLAYGSGADSLGEGTAAPDVSGRSLGRVPDGRDTQDNGSDWQPVEPPTPGAANATASRFVLLDWRVDPPWLAQPGAMDLTLRFRAQGIAAQQRGQLQWSIGSSGLDSLQLQASAGDTSLVQIPLSLASGRHSVVVAWAAPGEAADSLRLGLQVGAGQLALSEVLARPAPGHSEWIELFNLSSSACSSEGWTLSDSSRRPRRLDTVRVEPGSFAVVAGDPAGVCQQFDVPPAAPCLGVQGGWPSLNNTAASAGQPADEILLWDPAGVVVDYFAYDESLSPQSGRSMERGWFEGASAWFGSPGEPTPGRRNLAAAAPPERPGLVTAPNPFTPDGDGIDDVLQIVLRMETGGEDVMAEVLDLTGERVRDLGQAAGGALRQWLWDGRDGAGRGVALGAYVVVVRSPLDGRSWRSLVALGRP